MPRFYTGIGARATPPDILRLMTRAGFALTKRGYVLRSGHAIGADSAFERGAGRDAQVFLPASGWRGSLSALHPEALGAELWGRARDIAAAHHPAFAGLSPFVQALHTRNLFQVLGPALDSSAEFMLCWTADGEASGGTGQAMRIAATHGVPVFNLRRDRERVHVERHLVLWSIRLRAIAPFYSLPLSWGGHLPWRWGGPSPGTGKAHLMSAITVSFASACRHDEAACFAEAEQHARAEPPFEIDGRFGDKAAEIILGLAAMAF